MVSDEFRPRITKNSANDFGIGDVTPEILVHILSYLDPKSLAKFRRICRNFYGIALGIEAVYKKHADCEFAQRWCTLAKAQGHSNEEINVIADTAYSEDNDYAILMLVIDFAIDGEQKAYNLLKTRGILSDTMLGSMRHSVLSAILSFKPEDRISFVEQCRSMTTEKMTGEEIVEVVQIAAANQAASMKQND